MHNSDSNKNAAKKVTQNVTERGKFPQDRVSAVWDVPLAGDAPFALRLQSDLHPPVSP